MDVAPMNLATRAELVLAPQPKPKGIRPMALMPLDYPTMRAEFLEAAEATGAELHAYPHPQPGPNGEVIARVNSDGRVAQLFEQADQIVADGQPMVMASRRFCRRAIPCVSPAAR